MYICGLPQAAHREGESKRPAMKHKHTTRTTPQHTTRHEQQTKSQTTTGRTTPPHLTTIEA